MKTKILLFICGAFMTIGFSSCGVWDLCYPTYYDLPPYAVPPPPPPHRHYYHYEPRPPKHHKPHKVPHQKPRSERRKDYNRR